MRSSNLILPISIAISSAIAILLAGCSAREIEIDVGSGDLILLAALDAEGAVLETALLAADADSLPLPAADGGHLVAWRLPPGSLVDAAGGAVGGAVGADLTSEALRFVTTEEGDQEGCTRCLAAALAAPQTLFAGDLCAPPSFAPVEIYDHFGEPEDRPDLIAAAAMNTRLAVPGACAYPRFEPDPPVGLTACPLLPEEAPVASLSSALAEDGSIVGVTSGWRWRVDPAGTFAIEPVVPPLPGPVTLIASLEGSQPRFFYGAARTPVLVSGYDYYLLDQRMTPVLLRVEELDSFEVTLAVAAGDDGVVLYGNRHFDFTGAITREFVGCTVAGDQWSCAVEANTCFTDVDATSPDLIGLPDGAAVAMGNMFAYRPDGDDAWRCDESTRTAIPTASGDVIFTRYSDLARLGDSIFACGYDAALSGYVTIRAEVPDLAPGEDPTGRVTYSVVDRYFSPCSGFITVPEHPGRLIAISYGRAIALDENGTAAELLDTEALIPGFGVLPLTRMHQAGEWLAVESEFGFVHRRRGSEPLAPVYAPEYRRADLALAPLDDAIVWHRGGLEPAIVRRTGDDCASLTVETPGDAEWTVTTDLTSETSVGFPRDLSFNSATRAVLTADGSHLVFGPGFVRSVDFAARTVKQRVIDLFNIRDAIPFSDQRVLVVDAFGLWSMAPDGSELGPVPLVFDDPATPERESDGFAADSFWESASGVPGTAWAVGTDRIARIVAAEDGELRAEAYWTRRLATGIDRGFRVVHVLAPDDVLVSTANESAGGYYQLKVWRITSGPECSSDGELGICIDERFDTIHANGTGPFNAITHDAGQLTFYFRTGEIARPGGARTISAALFPGNAFEQNGLILMAGYGRLAAAISLDR